MDNIEKNSTNSLNLARKRTQLASTRTLLSHIRTALVLLSVAFAFMKLEKQKIDAITIVFFVLAGVFLLFGIIDYCATDRHIKKIVD